jgi:glycerol-3-phosphate cytidylyltransferase
MDKKPYRIGYTQGVYDMFHVGHLNLLQNAKKQCDKLIVGVNSDRLVMEYKHKKPVISEENRLRIVENIKAVDEAVIVDTLDKLSAYRQLGFDAVFIGDDWKGNARWAQTEKDLAPYGAQVVYLPHTPDISSTGLRIIREDSVGEEA